MAFRITDSMIIIPYLNNVLFIRTTYLVFKTKFKYYILAIEFESIYMVR